MYTILEKPPALFLTFGDSAPAVGRRADHYNFGMPDGPGFQSIVCLSSFIP
jgi:hypothetical protein